VDRGAFLRSCRLRRNGTVGCNSPSLQDGATFLNQRTVDTAIASIENRAARGSSWDIVDIDDYVNERMRRDGWRETMLHRILLVRPARFELATSRSGGERRKKLRKRKKRL
jgi:hypothetical protein